MQVHRVAESELGGSQSSGGPHLNTTRDHACDMHMHCAEALLDLCWSNVILYRGHHVASNASNPGKGYKVFSPLIDETLQHELSGLENAALVPRSHRVDKMALRVPAPRNHLFSEG
jgi:hypothetical protein